MSKINQEFFWTPDELTDWIRHVCAEFGLWLVVWRVGRSADVINPEAVHPSWFSGADDSVQLFLGDPALCSEPKWRIAGDRRELDFLGTYAVQLVPSLIANDGGTLLQGRLAIMRGADYGDALRYSALSALYGKLRSDLKRGSDVNHVIVQTLSGGKKKRWGDMLVSPVVARSAISLRQFSKGAVEFRIEPA